MPASVGVVTRAIGGTVFLDEIGDMDSGLQHHLLRALEKHVRVVGEAESRIVDVRFIGATNSPRERIIHDLFPRLPLVVELPSLNNHREDIPALIYACVFRLLEKNPNVERYIRRVPGQLPQIAIKPELVTTLLRHNYTGSVRELEKLLELSAVGGNDDVLGIPECLRSEIPQPTEEERQKAQAEAVLAKHNGNLSAAAKELGINRDAVARLTGRRLD